MKVVVGLGNPGSKYANTRHNAGARVVETLWEAERAQPARGRLAWAAPALLGRQQVVLARPRTYMNDSGRAVQALLRRYRVRLLAELLVVVDDMDLPLGALRLRPGGSEAGHNGLKSIVEAVGSREFPRLRLGIGRPPEGVDPIDYVLGDFGPEERERVEAMIRRAVEAVRCWAELGAAETMNRFNRSEPSTEASAP